MHQEWKTKPWSQTLAQREQKGQMILQGCWIARRNVDSGKCWNFGGYVLYNQICTSIFGAACGFEIHMLEFSLGRCL